MEIKIFSFNLRVRVSCDGINMFDYRLPRVLGCIEEYNPDLIGFQECTEDMLSAMENRLFELGYSMLGCGRESNLSHEGMYIAYKRNKFRCRGYETKWLSDTPDVPGSRFDGDQSSCPRCFTAAYLKPADSDEFIFINTHLDHEGKSARLNGAREIMDFVKEKNMRFIITGDMNALPGDPEIKEYTREPVAGRKVTDVTAFLGNTFCGYDTESAGIKIDYIFTNLKTYPDRSYRVPNYPVHGIFISDHCPVCGFAEV